MLKFITGDLFAIPADIRINTVNCRGVMGAGLALAFKTRYPAMFEDYQWKCRAGKIKPGGIDEWTDPETRETIINFATKDDWRKPSRPEYIRDGLSELREYLKKRGKVRVALPALGAGHGGLDWVCVKKMIATHLADLDAEITVFSPIDSQEMGRKDAEATEEVAQARLRAEGVLMMTPGDAAYPAVLRGRSEAELSIKGDLNHLNRRLVAILPSDKPDQREESEVRACAGVFARAGVSCLVGYGPGMERNIIRALLEQGGDVVTVFGPGIAEFKVTKDLREVWDDTRVTVISVARPTQPWKRELASILAHAARDLQIKLATALLVTHPSPPWLAKYIRAADAWRLPPIFYLDYGRDDVKLSALLDQIGARPVRQISDLPPLLEIVHGRDAPPMIEQGGVPETDGASATVQDPGPVEAEQATRTVLVEVETPQPEVLALASMADEQQPPIIYSVSSLPEEKLQQLSLLPGGEEEELQKHVQKARTKRSRRKSDSQQSRKRKHT